jgi:RNA polymerase sigma-70 factor (ECF subfamily)
VPAAGSAAIERAYRESSGRAIATLAFAVAAERWPETGMPPNPGGWIVTTARNKALDRLRREPSRADRLPLVLAVI